MKHRLDRDDWNFLLTAAFTIYGLGALFLLLLAVTADSFREIVIALSLFSPFFFSLFLIKSFREFLVLESKLKTWGAVALMAFGFFMFALAGVGYVDFINALSAPAEVHLAEGEIKKMEPRRRGAPRVYLSNGHATINNISITDEEYERLRVGDYYVSNMRVGGLGLYYRWRIDSWNRGWEGRAAYKQKQSRQL